MVFERHLCSDALKGREYFVRTSIQMNRGSGMLKVLTCALLRRLLKECLGRCSIRHHISGRCKCSAFVPLPSLFPTHYIGLMLRWELCSLYSLSQSMQIRA